MNEEQKLRRKIWLANQIMHDLLKEDDRLYKLNQHTLTNDKMRGKHKFFTQGKGRKEE